MIECKCEEIKALLSDANIRKIAEALSAKDKVEIICTKDGIKLLRVRKSELNK